MRLHNNIQSFFEHPWFLFVLRVVPGVILFLFAFGKAIEDHGVFYEAVKQYQLLPEAWVPVLASSLIYIEIVVGALIVLGLFTRVAAGLGVAMLLMFIVFIVQALLRGIPLTDCGCGGGLISLGDTPAEVLSRNMLMLAALAWLVAAKAKSALRFDALFEDSKGRDL